MNVASAQTSAKVAPKEDPAERAYANAHKRTLLTFFIALKKIKAQPDPIFPPGSTRSQKRDIVARQDDAVAATASASYKDMLALKPTPNLQAVHQSSLELLASFRDTHKAHAAAYRGGDRKKAEAAWKAIWEKTKLAMDKLRAAAANTRERDGSLPKRRKSGIK